MRLLVQPYPMTLAYKHDHVAHSNVPLTLMTLPILSKTMKESGAIGRALSTMSFSWHSGGGEPGRTDSRK